MERIEMLEKLRDYDFFRRINYEKEFEDRLEKLLIMASKTKIFQLKNGEKLSYETIVKLLKKKNIEISKNKREVGKLKIQNTVMSNIESLKIRILNDLNEIFNEDEIEFIIDETVNSINEEEVIKINNKNMLLIKMLNILKKYPFKKISKTPKKAFRERLEKLLIMASKSKLIGIKGIDNFNYEVIFYLLEKKEIKMQMKKSEYKSRVYSSKVELQKYEIVNDLNFIFKNENIEFCLIGEEEYNSEEKRNEKLNSKLIANNLPKLYEEINKNYKTLFLNLDNIPENKYQNLINYVNEKGYRLKIFSKIQVAENKIETRVIFEKTW